MASDRMRKLQSDKVLVSMMSTEQELKPRYINTNVASLNLVFSGMLNGGLPQGHMGVIAAASAQGKSLIGYNLLAMAYKKGMDCIVLDAERAFNKEYCEQLGVKFDDILVFQSSNIGELKQIIAKFNEDTTKEQRKNTFVLLDSWGPLVNNTIIDKALAGTTTADMGKSAQDKNGLANLILSYDNTFFVISHVMDNMNPFAGEAFGIPGGRRLIFDATCIGLCTSAAKYKDKDGTILGKVVTITVHKGRGAKEFNRTKFLIRHDGGLDPFFGLLDDAVEGGFVYKPKNGYYARTDYDVDKETGECNKMWKESELYCADFWVPLYKDEKFNEYMGKKFSFLNTELISSQFDLMEQIGGEETNLSNTGIDGLDEEASKPKKKSAKKSEVAE